MRVLLISGGMHRTIVRYAERNCTVVNELPLTLTDSVFEYLDKVNPLIDGVLVTDGAFAVDTTTDRSAIEQLVRSLSDRRAASPVPIVVLTTDVLLHVEMSKFFSEKIVKMIICPHIRLTIPDIYRAYEAIRLLGKGGHFTAPSRISSKAKKLQNEKQTISAEAPDHNPINDSQKTDKSRLSLFDRFRSKVKSTASTSPSDPLAKGLENISRGISRVVAVTGHRGSGVTSGAVNLAYEASKRGLSTMLIDMDTDYRSTNLYFNRYHAKAKSDEQLQASLIRMLARPQDYETTSYNLRENLWLTSLGYEFSDELLMQQFYTSTKLISLLSVLRNSFQLIIVDMPLDLYKHFSDTLIHFDVFALCVPNNLHAVISTLRNIEVVFDRENASYFNAKTKVVVTQYNDRARLQNEMFTPERVNEVLTSGLSDKFTYETGLAGYIPYRHDYDIQIESDIPVVETSTDYEQAFSQLLLRLIGGAN